jgi:DNA-binding protein HU-beta
MALRIAGKPGAIRSPVVPREIKQMAAATKMTQSSMIKDLAAATGTSTKVAKTFVTAYVEMILKETKKNGVSIVPGLGKLVRVERKARTGRNPATGATIKIAAKKVVKFRIAKAVKDAVVPPKKAK